MRFIQTVNIKCSHFASGTVDGDVHGENSRVVVGTLATTRHRLGEEEGRQ